MPGCRLFSCCVPFFLLGFRVSAKDLESRALGSSGWQRLILEVSRFPCSGAECVATGRSLSHTNTLNFYSSWVAIDDVLACNVNEGPAEVRNAPCSSIKERERERARESERECYRERERARERERERGREREPTSGSQRLSKIRFAL